MTIPSVMHVRIASLAQMLGEGARVRFFRGGFFFGFYFSYFFGYGRPLPAGSGVMRYPVSNP